MPDAQKLNFVRAKVADAGLPPALIPPNVAGVTLDDTTGAFTLNLDGEHRITPGGHQVSYARTIKGRLQPGALVDLEGVTVKVGFVWPSISRIERSTDGRKLTFVVMGTRHELDAAAFG